MLVVLKGRQAHLASLLVQTTRTVGLDLSSTKNSKQSVCLGLDYHKDCRTGSEFGEELQAISADGCGAPLAIGAGFFLENVHGTYFIKEKLRNIHALSHITPRRH